MEQGSSKEKPAGNRQFILESAARLIMEKGVEKTSLSDIAKAVGISKGTLYYYYTSKSELIFDITELHMQRITDHILSILEKKRNEMTLKEILVMVFETFLKEETREKLHLYLLQDAITGNEKLSAKFREKYDEWRKLIEKEVEKVLKDTGEQSAVLAYIIVAAIDGLVIQSIINQQKIPVEQIAGWLSAEAKTKE